MAIRMVIGANSRALISMAPPVISRNPVDLLDARVGVETADWTLVFWAKNLNNANYNAEYSPGGFVFKALPRRWGIDLTRRF